jgi:hypothetical protein
VHGYCACHGKLRYRIRSIGAHLVRDEAVAGSNPATHQLSCIFNPLRGQICGTKPPSSAVANRPGRPTPWPIGFNDIFGPIAPEQRPIFELGWNMRHTRCPDYRELVLGSARLVQNGRDACTLERGVERFGAIIGAVGLTTGLVGRLTPDGGGGAWTAIWGGGAGG